ncbi:hypothetical protein RF657_08845 [Yersinia rochesterensis]|uniref:hypothetical protein n=1 Tax=Yersinia rochesterensis TaxID=1604335 RepID=UPI00285329C6|nr:hypothetical protein [Yersinia rochesterensis]MDR5018498.1 hypothetical protein [Yersinia rochesterensis]
MATVLLTTTFGVLANEFVMASRDSNYGEAMQYAADQNQKSHPDTKITLVKHPPAGVGHGETSAAVTRKNGAPQRIAGTLSLTLNGLLSFRTGRYYGL